MALQECPDGLGEHGWADVAGIRNAWLAGAVEKMRSRSVRLSTVDGLSMSLSMNAYRPLTGQTAMTGTRSAFTAPDSPGR